MPYVYIIVLNWNGWQMTARCLQSLQRITYPRYRILVVDNGSSDDSVRHLKEMFPEQEILVNSDNLGYGGGNNKGIEKALSMGADYVWVVNNDATAEPGALAALVAVAEARPDVGAVGSVMYSSEDAQVEMWGGGRTSLWLGTIHCFKEPVMERKLDYLTGASLLLRRKALETLGMFDDAFFLYWEDTDLGFRLRRGGWKLAVAPDSRLLHLGSGSLGKKSVTRDYYIARSAVRFFRKHAVLPFVPITIGISARIIARIVRREWACLGATCRGAWAEIRHGLINTGDIAQYKS